MIQRRLVLHAWRVRDPLTGRWHTLRYKAEEDHVRRSYAEYALVPGSAETREFDDAQLTAGHLARGPRTPGGDPA